MRRGTFEVRNSVGIIAIAMLAISALALVLNAWANSGADRIASSRVRGYPTPSVGTNLPTALFIGDSYTQGVGASSLDNAFISLVALAERWRPVNGGYGGTGYLATAGRSACGLAYCPSFGESLRRSAGARPEVVVISGGRNDISFRPTKFAGAVDKTLREARDLFPLAKIYVVLPIWDDRPAPAFIGEAREAVRQAALSSGATYLDIGEPLFDQSALVSADGIHPNDAGHAAIARALIKALGETQG